MCVRLPNSNSQLFSYRAGQNQARTSPVSMQPEAEPGTDCSSGVGVCRMYHSYRHEKGGASGMPTGEFTAG